MNNSKMIKMVAIAVLIVSLGGMIVYAGSKGNDTITDLSPDVKVGEATEGFEDLDEDIDMVTVDTEELSESECIDISQDVIVGEVTEGFEDLDEDIDMVTVDTEELSESECIDISQDVIVGEVTEGFEDLDEDINMDIEDVEEIIGQ